MCPVCVGMKESMSKLSLVDDEEEDMELVGSGQSEGEHWSEICLVGRFFIDQQICI